MSKFNTLCNSILCESGVLPWKEVPEEIKEEANRLIDEHNSKVTLDPKKGSYLIDVTGKHQVYYTFWRFREIDPRFAAFIKNPIYFGNLSTDLLGSVKKVLSKSIVADVPVELMTDETRQGMIGRTKKTPAFTFGKYRGKTFPEVYLEDPAYFAWLSKNANDKYARTETSLAIGAFAQMYFDDVTKKNQETSTSEFVGKVGDSYQGELELYNVKYVEPKAYQDGYTVFKMKDSNGNKFISYKFPTEEVGTTIKIKAKIRDHKEILGVKFNKLGYIKEIK